MIQLKKYNIFKDERGSLLPIEFDTLPFEPKRTFTVTNVPKNTIRGEHAHYKTEQVLICIEGEIDVILFDGTDTAYTTIHPGESVYVPSLIWDSQKFLTGKDVLLVLCSTEFDETDYIGDKEQFIRITKNAS